MVSTEKRVSTWARARAAIASLQAAREHGLEVLAYPIDRKSVV